MIVTPPVCLPVPRLGAVALVCALAALLPGCPEDPEPPAPRLELSPVEVSFEEVVRGHPQTRTVEVWNGGTDILEVGEIELEGDGFSMSSPLPDQGGLGPGEGSWIEIAFDPTADGPSIGSVTVHSSDPDAPERKVAIQGVGTSTGAWVNPTEVLFDPVPVSVVNEATVRLHSVGEEPLTLYEVRIVQGHGLFAIESINVAPGPETQLHPNGPASVVVSYQPSVDGDAFGWLEFLTDDPQEPLISVPLIGYEANSVPRCGVAEYPQGSIPEFTKADLAAWAADGQDDPSELWFDWIDFDMSGGGDAVIYQGPPDADGRVEVAHELSGVGSHQLSLWVSDSQGLLCIDEPYVQVVENEVPTVTIVSPAPWHYEAQECIDFIGWVADPEDGYELPVMWTSSHPQAPVPLLAGTADGKGFTEFVLCDLPCGQQTITLETLDSGNQPSLDSALIDITVNAPTLAPIPDQEVVLGQVAQIPLVAQSSCGVQPQITLAGEPPSATIVGGMLTYQPLYSPKDNPVGQTFEIEVHAEITHGNHTAVDDTTFQLTVVSDEFLAVSGEQPDEVQLLFNEYDGSWTSAQVQPLPFSAQPGVVADLDGDGAADLLAVDDLGGAWALVRRVDGGFDEVPLGFSVEGPVSAGDVDGDGLIDLVALDPMLSGTTQLNRTVLAGQPAFDAVPATLDLSGVAPQPEPVLAASLVDHDGDGRDDLVVAFFGEPDSPVYLLPAHASDDGAFDSPQLVLQAPPTRGLAHGLLDADGIPDLLTGGAAVGDPGQAYLHPGDGQLGFGGPLAAFDARPQIETLNNVDEEPGESRYWTTDADHDGCTDLVVAFISYLDPTGHDSVLSVGVVLQQEDTGQCLGLFGDGSGEDGPDVLLVTTAPAEVAAPDGT